MGFRAAARALRIVSEVIPGGKFPSANGGQWWLLRLGLYELQRPKEKGDDWVWLIDHTIQTGNGKCFVVFAFRLSLWQARREQVLREDPDASFALQHHELAVWQIERVDRSDGDIVRQQLESLSVSTGIVPCCILCDQGADVRNGGNLFAAANDHQTALVHDIAHATANALKRELSNDPQWQSFIDEANRLKTKVRQSPLAFLMPPELCNKARWMNLSALIQWSNKMSVFLSDVPSGLSRASVTLDPQVAEQKISWLRNYEASIARWTTILGAITMILKFIRNHGYHRETPARLRVELASLLDGPAAGVFAEVLKFVEIQSQAAGDQTLPGSSEVLESLLGRGKQMMGSTKNGYTKSILGMAAAVTEKTSETIEHALASVKVKDVKAWLQRQLGISLQAQRIRGLQVPVAE